MSQMVVKIGGDAAGFRKALNDTRTSAKQAGANISNSLAGGMKNFAAPLAGLVSAGALTALTKQIINFAGELDYNSKKLGITTEAYQQLDYMAKVSGADMGAVGVALKGLSGDLTDAADGNQEAAAKFGMLGLAIQDLKGLSPDKLFETVAKKIADIKDPTERTARAVDMFGKAGMNLMGMAQDFDALKKQASETASIMDSEAIAAAAKFNDTMTALFTNIAAGVGRSPLLKWLADAAEGMNALTKETAQQAGNQGWYSSGLGKALAFGVDMVTAGYGSDWMERKSGASGVKMYQTEEEKKKLEEYRKKAEAAKKEGKTGKDIEREEAAAKAAKEEDIKRETAARKIREAQEKLEESGRKELADMEKKIRLEAMRAAGMEKEASILEKELALREKLNRPLTQDEYSNLQNLASAEQAVADYKDAQKNMNFGQPEQESAIGLEKIGAVYRGSFDSGRDRILNMQLDQLKKLHEALKEVQQKMGAEALR